MNETEATVLAAADALVAAFARHDRDACRHAGIGHGQHLPGQLGEPGGARAVGRLVPALPAAHHAGHQRQGGRIPQPVTEEIAEDLREAAGRHVEDALGRGALLEH